MAYRQDVKELAYTLDPPCWVSYSGKSRLFKAAMDERRSATLKHAQSMADRLRPKGLRTRPSGDCDDKLTEIVSEIGVRFRTFGGGLNSSWNNPIAAAIKDRPLQFAAGVDVEEVVRFVLANS